MQKFEPDQLVLVRYGNDKTWRLKRYSFLANKNTHETQDGSLWDDDHIIPYEGNQHLIGTTHEPPQKWEPKPGELVAVRREGFDYWVIAIFVGWQNGRFVVSNRSDRVTDANLFSYCEPLRKHFTITEE